MHSLQSPFNHVSICLGLSRFACHGATCRYSLSVGQLLEIQVDPMPLGFQWIVLRAKARGILNRVFFLPLHLHLTHHPSRISRTLFVSLF